MDTGSSDIWEIEKAVVAIEEEGMKTSSSIIAPQAIRLHLFHSFKHDYYLKRNVSLIISLYFQITALGADTDIAAVSLGAGMVEKTITLDRYTKSCEHSRILLKEKRFICFCGRP